VAIILEATRRLLADLDDDVELIVLSTGAEEDHMVGAMRWLDAFANGLAGPVFCLNFDGAGAAGRSVLIERYGLGRLFSPVMSAAVRRAAARLGLKPRGILMMPGLGIDAIPFAHRGLPCLTLASGSLGRATMSVHSPNDRAEHLDADTLAEITDLAVETVKELSQQR
jgi:acetylornithine deacetylase/succinyl-diaminopimelate desuccinylase-like protein